VGKKQIEGRERERKEIKWEFSGVMSSLR